MEFHINKKCFTPNDNEYYYPIYLDWWGLIRRVWIDLEQEFGFEIGWWNQGYQFDTLPIKLKEEEIKAGDLIFYSAKLYDKNGKVHPHEMVHVEMFLGTNGDPKSIGSRRKGGVIQEFPDFRFVSNRFYNTKYHFWSLETWLDGVCKSGWDEHDWKSTKKLGSYYANIHKKKRKEKEREQLCMIDISDYIESMDKYQNSCYVNFNFHLKPLMEWMEKLSFTELDRVDAWNYKARLSFVNNLNELDYARFKIGYHMVNRIPCLYPWTSAKNVIKLWKWLKISMRLGYLDTFVDLNEIISEAYVLDFMPDLWRFLNWENTGTWDLVSQTYTNSLNVTVVPDILKFKSKILCLRDLSQDEIDSASESEEENDGDSDSNDNLSPCSKIEESK